MHSAGLELTKLTYIICTWYMYYKIDVVFMSYLPAYPSRPAYEKNGMMCTLMSRVDIFPLLHDIV